MTLLTKSMQKPSSTKEQIISILSKEWPLTIKEIHQKLTIEFYTDITYQAVHKTVSEIEEQKVIKNTNKKFKLDEQWLEDQKKFFLETEAKYTGRENKYIIDPDKTEAQVFEFNDISTFCITMADMLNNQIIHDAGDGVGVGIVRHLWFPTSFKFVDFNLLKTLGKVNRETYLIVKNNTTFDRWLAKQYEKAKLAPIKLGVDLPEIEDDYAARGGYAFQIHFSEETKKIIDEYYERTNGLSDLLKEYVQNQIPKNKIKITVTVYRNKDMVEMIKKQVLSKIKETEK